MASTALLSATICGQPSQRSPQLTTPFSLSVEVRSEVRESREPDLRPLLQDVYKRVKEVAISTLPKSVLHGQQGVVTIELEVQKNGSLGRSAPLAVIGNSGKKELEKHAMNAIRAAEPFEPLPASSPAPLILRSTFYYNTPLPPH